LEYLFLDARNFIAPNVDLKKFGLMFGVKDIQKELFPYDWFSSVVKVVSSGSNIQFQKYDVGVGSSYSNLAGALRYAVGSTTGTFDIDTQ
jgi:hypothetical protein